MVRVTQGAMVSQFLADLTRTSAAMAKKQREITTGMRINNAADDPAGIATLLSQNAQLRDIARYKSNIDDGLGFTDTADSALGSMTDAMQRIRELMLQAGNGTLDQNARDAIADEIAQLKETIRAGANTRYGARYVFSGGATDTQPYPIAAGNAYMGIATAAPGDAINQRIGPGDQQIQINVTGTDVIGTTTGALPSQMDLFDLIDTVVADLQSGVPAQLANVATINLDALDTHLDNVLAQRSHLGAVSNRLESMRNSLGMLEERLTEARSNVGEADMAKTIMEYQTHATMYQGALAAGSRLLQTSLLDFL